MLGHSFIRKMRTRTNFDASCARVDTVCDGEVCMGKDAANMDVFMNEASLPSGGHKHTVLVSIVVHNLVIFLQIQRSTNICP